MINWTKGPWVVKNPESVDNISVNTVNGDYFVATTHGWAGEDADDYTCASNAHLIAAAPELYEALEVARAMINAYNRAIAGQDYEDMGVIDVALSKARGEAQ